MDGPSVLFLTGPISSGKTTMSKQLGGYVHLSSGELLNEVVTKGTILNEPAAPSIRVEDILRIKNRMREGELVDTHDLIYMLSVPFDRIVAKSKRTNGELPKLVLDGYIRKPDQIRHWLGLSVSWGYDCQHTYVAVRLELSLEECLKRSTPLHPPEKIEKMYLEDQENWPLIQSELQKQGCPIHIVDATQDPGSCMEELKKGFSIAKPLPWSGNACSKGQQF